MYDKYLTGNTFTVGTPLPRHKGFILHYGNTALANGFTAYIMAGSGTTMAMNFPLVAGINYISNQFHSINAISAGVTGIILS